MREAIVINDNFTSPDSYRFFLRNVMAPWWWKFNRKVGVEPVIRLKRAKVDVCLRDEKWLYTRQLAQRKYPIVIYEDDGRYEPVMVKRVDGLLTREMLDTDLWRDFKKALGMKHKLTESLWGKVSKLLTVGLLSILGLAAVIVIVVLINKFAVEHTSVLRGASAGGDFLNSTIARVVG